MPTCSLLITTYNWRTALTLCLHSVKAQSKLPDEVIIADDGSRQDTRALIEAEAANFPVPLIHVWQPDEGFQLSKIRNKGIAKATGDYIVQIDGDVILHPKFIQDHLSFSRRGTFVSGSRVSLSAKASAPLFKTEGDEKKIRWIDKHSSLNSFRSRLLRNWLAYRYKNKGRHTYYVKGCNMAFWREDAIAVNGYNESFTGWGPEDSEFAARLMNRTIQKRFIKFGAVMYHLYHKEVDKSRERTNYSMLLDAIENKTIRCTTGIDQYLQ